MFHSDAVNKFHSITIKSANPPYISQSLTMKFEAIMTSALFVSLTDAAAPGYGYKKGLITATAYFITRPIVR
jgi:hypothetical protein